MTRSADVLPANLAAAIVENTPAPVAERYASLPRRAEESDFGEFDRNIVVLDTETTGISLKTEELTQIAAARLEHGQVTDWFVTFVNPGKPIPEEISRLTSITDADVADAPSPTEALEQLVAFVGDAKVVAHNAEFDRNFTTKHVAGYPLLDNLWIDSLELARIALPRMRSHRLIDLVKAFDAPLSTHRADADVAATCALYRLLLAAVDSMPSALLAKVASLADQEAWPTGAVFSFFAERHQQEADQQSGAAARPEPFAIRSLRRVRVAEEPTRSKDDAEQLAASPQGLRFPSEEAIDKAFSKDGLVGSLYASFEPRVEQRAMARAVGHAFAASENLVVEAGTGVGKSMAYLVPAALTARANNVTVGVATKTNALLDQLVYHELPALAEALQKAEPDAPPLAYAALKGFSHYICLRKAQRLAEGGARLRPVAGVERTQAPAIATLLSFIEQTGYDDLDSLKIDRRLLPKVAYTTTSHECLRRKCPFFGTTCFVHGARRRAQGADVVVTNHSLLFCDLAADNGLLPPSRFWVVDEAHSAENEARRAFSLTLSAEEISFLARRLGEVDSTRNVFVRAERNVTAPGSDGDGTLFFALTAKAKKAGSGFAEASAAFNERLRDLLFFDDSPRAKGYDTVEVWVNDQVRASQRFAGLAEAGAELVERAEKLTTACQELVGYLEDVEGAQVIQREIASAAMELKELVNAADVILRKGGEEYVYAATLSRKPERIQDRIEALPYNVGATLAETFYASTFSVVYASATLAVGSSFRSFEEAMGLGADEGGPGRPAELQLSSSYDFDSHMKVYVPEDMPEPNDPAYLPELQALLAAAHVAQQGSMLTLFTNRREMEACFDAVDGPMRAHDLRLVQQRKGISIKGLRDEFLADEHLSLFALKSFWEGFDAPGATLRGVVIPKLPFAKPSDPLACERSQRHSRAWQMFSLPQAVLEVKQAAGRLIRSAEDEGILILADRRVLTKGYGRHFLESLPSRTIMVAPMDEIVADIERRRP